MELTLTKNMMEPSDCAYTLDLRAIDLRTKDQIKALVNYVETTMKQLNAGRPEYTGRIHLEKIVLDGNHRVHRKVFKYLSKLSSIDMVTSLSVMGCNWVNIESMEPVSMFHGLSSLSVRNCRFLTAIPFARHLVLQFLDIHGSWVDDVSSESGE